MREAILRIIRTRRGAKGIDISLELMSEVGPCNLDEIKMYECLESLVKQGEIIEIDYILPPCVAGKLLRGVFYLPKNSIVLVRPKDENGNLDS